MISANYNGGPLSILKTSAKSHAHWSSGYPALCYQWGFPPPFSFSPLGPGMYKITTNLYLPRLRHRLQHSSLSLFKQRKSGKLSPNGHQNFDWSISYQNTSRQVATPSFSSKVKKISLKTNFNFRLLQWTKKLWSVCATTKFESLELISEYRPCTFLFSE